MFSGSENLVADYQRGTLAGFGDYVAYSYWDPATGKNVVAYKNVSTGET